MFSHLLVAAAVAAGVAAQATAPQWGQCGGQGWTGATVCPSGWVCTYSNPYYSQCLQGTGSTTSKPVTSSSPSSSSSSSQPTITPTTTVPTSSAPSGTATSGPLGSTLLPGNLWIRAVEAPNFHKYLQSANNGQPGPAVFGDYTTAGQFQLNNGQLQMQLSGGSVLYLTVNQTAPAGQTYFSSSFTTTPPTSGTFVFNGDGLTWTAPGVTRQNNGAFLACGTGVPGVYFNLGAYAYMTPAGCADETLNYYNGATAVP